MGYNHTTKYKHRHSWTPLPFRDTSPLHLWSRSERRGPQKLQEPHALLLGMYTGHTFSENCLEVSTRTQYRHILWPSNFIHRYVPTKQLNAYTHQKGMRVSKADKKWKPTWMFFMARYPPVLFTTILGKLAKCLLHSTHFINNCLITHFSHWNYSGGL